METIIKNINACITCDDVGRVLRGVDLLMQNGRITAIGSNLCAGADAQEIDGKNLWVYPGLINTHHHLYQYFTRNLPAVRNMALFPWLQTLYPIWARLNADSVYHSTLLGGAELLLHGCTTLMDHHYVFPQNAGDLMEAQFAAADVLGLRFAACRGSMNLSQKDGGLPPDSVVQNVDAILADTQRTAERFNDPAPFSMRQVLAAPCSPFSVSADLLRESAKLARSLGLRLHTHLAETADEERFALEKYKMRPLAYMETVDFIGPDVFYAHGIHFNDAEIALLAATGTGVAHCPGSNMKLNSGVMRIAELKKAGVPLGLAVDGSASNDNSNLLAEIRAAYLLHRLIYGEHAPDGYELLKLATRGSAALLGRPELGQLAVGKAADLFAIRCDAPCLIGAENDPSALFGTVGWHAPADLVMVGGKTLVRDGQLLSPIGEGSLEAARKAQRALFE